MAKKASSDWRVQQLAVYRTLANMAGNVGRGYSIAPTIPTYTAKPYRRKATTADAAAQFWANPNNARGGSSVSASNKKNENKNKRSVFETVMDALSVGSYATAGMIDAAITNSTKQANEVKSGKSVGFDPFEAVGAAFGGLGKGAASAFTDGKKTTFSDVITHGIDEFDKADDGKVNRKKGVPERIAAAGSGFALDVFADPLTYVPVANVASIIGKIGKGGKAATKLIGELTNASKTATKFADEPAKAAKPNVAKQASQARQTSQELVPTGVGKTSKFSGPAMPTGDNFPDASGFKLNYDAINSGRPSSIAARVANPAVGAISKGGRAIDPTTIMSTLEDTTPRTMIKDTGDTVGDTLKDAVSKSPVEQTAKVENTVKDTIDEVVNLSAVQHNAKNTNPALSKTTRYADWERKARAGEYSPEQLQPFMDYHKVDNIDDLADAMRGKNFSATRDAIRKGMREAEVKKVQDILPGSAASVADRTADAALQAEKIVDGDLNKITDTKIEFADPEFTKVVDKASADTFRKNISIPARSGNVPGKKGLNYYTAGDAKRGAKGRTTFIGSNNIMDQSTAGSRVLKEAVGYFVKKNGGAKLTDDQVDLAIAALKRHEQAASAVGYIPHMGRGASGMPLGLSDALTAMPKAFVRKYLVGNFANQLHYRTFFTAVGEALQSGIKNPDELKAAIKESILNMEGGLSKTAKSNALQPEFTSKGRQIKNKDFVDEATAADEIANTIVDSLPNLTEAAVNAAKLAKVKVGNFVHAVSAPQIKKIADNLALNKDGKAIEEFLNATDMFKAEAKKLGLKNTDDIIAGAQKDLADSLGLTPEAVTRLQDEVKTADKLGELYDDGAGIDDLLKSVDEVVAPKTKPKSAKEKQRIINEAKSTAADSVREAFQDATEVAGKAGSSADNLGDATYDTAMRNAAGILGGLNRMLNGSAGMGDLAGTFHKGEQMIRAVTGQFASELTKIQKTFPRDEITKQFNLFRTGNVGEVAPDLQKLFNMAFDGGRYNRMSRAGVSRDNFLYQAEKQGITEDMLPKFNTDNPFGDVKLPVGKDGQPDVLAYLKNMFTAQVETLKYSEMGKGFSANFGQKVRPGKDWFKPSLSSTSDRSLQELSHYIDPNLYYPKEILDGLSAMNGYIKQMSNVNNYGKANALMKNVKTVTGKWKLWNTVVRPGHHVKNQVGDMTLTFLAGYTNPDIYPMALRILKNFDKDYRGLDGLAKRMDEDLFGIPPQVDSTTGKINKWGGKDFPDEEIHAAAMQENVLTSFYTAEDLAFSGLDQSTKAAKGLAKPFKAIENAGGTVSEYRDKHVRLAHFVATTRKIAKKHPNWSKSKIYGEAGSEVRKWHPNGTGLSPWENKYGKLGIMFYSWQRQVLPLMLESMVTRPGRVTVAPKMMYAIAEAQGIDLDSFGDPFPADNIYPDFLTEGAYGPQWQVGDKQYGVKPGFPQNDFLTEMGTPKAATDTILSSINPLARVPVEFATGRRLGVDNIPITDKSEYIDQNIPLASYLNNLTGRSTSTGLTQRTRKAEEGRQPSISTTLINLLTGMGITDYTDPKFKKIAERDLKEREKNAG